MQVTDIFFDMNLQIIQEHLDAPRKGSYLDSVAKIINDYRQAVRMPTIAIKVFAIIRRAARSARSAVRQTFAARKAAKSSDGGGGDPDGRPPLTFTLKNPRNTPFSAAFLLGGAL